jgi:hypothetical protein
LELSAISHLLIAIEFHERIMENVAPLCRLCSTLSFFICHFFHFPYYMSPLCMDMKSKIIPVGTTFAVLSLSGSLTPLPDDMIYRYYQSNMR